MAETAEQRRNRLARTDVLNRNLREKLKAKAVTNPPSGQVAGEEPRQPQVAGGADPWYNRASRYVAGQFVNRAVPPAARAVEAGRGLAAGIGSAGPEIMRQGLGMRAEPPPPPRTKATMYGGGAQLPAGTFTSTRRDAPPDMSTSFVQLNPMPEAGGVAEMPARDRIKQRELAALMMDKRGEIANLRRQIADPNIPTEAKYQLQADMRRAMQEGAMIRAARRGMVDEVTPELARERAAAGNQSMRQQIAALESQASQQAFSGNLDPVARRDAIERMKRLQALQESGTFSDVGPMFERQAGGIVRQAAEMRGETSAAIPVVDKMMGDRRQSILDRTAYQQRIQKAEEESRAAAIEAQPEMIRQSAGLGRVSQLNQQFEADQLENAMQAQARQNPEVLRADNAIGQITGEVVNRGLIGAGDLENLQNYAKTLRSAIANMPPEIVASQARVYADQLREAMARSQAINISLEMAAELSGPGLATGGPIRLFNELGRRRVYNTQMQQLLSELEAMGG